LWLVYSNDISNESSRYSHGCKVEVVCISFFV
jgi:hypothetical protein